MTAQIKSIISEIISKNFKINLDNIEFSSPPHGQSGDLATNVTFAIAEKINQSPKAIAEKITQELTKQKNIIKSTEIGGAGFLNFKFTDDFLFEQLANVYSDFGLSKKYIGKKARVEYVSANPTGPLHIGNARGGPLGDTIANVLQATGYKVLREYLNNDIGGQIEELGKSIVGDGNQYQGQYIKELRSKIKTKNAEEAGRQAVQILFDEIIDDCQAMGIKFDKIFNESEILTSGKTEGVLKNLKLKEFEGAKWSEVSGARDTVVVRSSGEPTYFANDIGYHSLKFKAGYDLVVDVLGSNHHGHIPRLQKVAQDLGFDLKKLKFILYQFVRVKRGNTVVKMSKRAGDFVTAREVLDEVGRDAFRFFMLMHDPNTHIDFDLELAKKKSKENPVFYVQYGCVRARSIIQKSKIKSQNYNAKLQINETERKLIIKLLQLPELVEDISQTLQVHKLTHYAIDVAKIFHDFYEKNPVIEKSRVNQSRLKIVQATLVVLQNTLQLIGVDIPNKM